jgi:hypothetical protein
LARALLSDVPLLASKSAKANLISTTAKALLHGLPNDDARRRLHSQLLGSIGDAGQVKRAAAAAMVELVLIRLLAARNLAQQTVPDHIIAWSRVWHLFGLRNYIASQQTGSLPDIPGVDFSTPDFEKLIPNACRDLVSAVGMALSLSKSEALPAPFFHPDSWQDGWDSIRVHWHIRPSAIILPNGRQHAHIQIEVSDQPAS